MLEWPKGKNKNRKIQNSIPINEWLVADAQEYKTKFAGKKLSDRPKLLEKSVCQRFHSKGYCFSDCFNKETHIPSKDIDNVTKEGYSNYCKICRD